MTSFRGETWTSYGFAQLFIVSRLFVRTRKLGGIRQWQAEDWVAVNTTFWFTSLIIALNKVVYGGGSNFMTAEEQAASTPETKAERVEGSKWVLVSEQAMILTVWSCKVIMLSIYRRLTEGLSQRRFINIAAVWTFLGFIATQIALFTACRPFWGYWTVPAPTTQCWSYWNFEYVEGVFNITADVGMLLVAFPIVARVRLPSQQKAPISGVFGMGAFVIAAAICTKVYCFVPSLLSYEYLNWYARESSIGIIVTNSPAVWSFLRDIFPESRKWGYRTSSGSRSEPAYASGEPRSRITLTGNGDERYDMQHMGGSDIMKRSTSEEHIIPHGNGPVNGLTIEKNTTVVVSEDLQWERDYKNREDTSHAVSLAHDSSDMHGAQSRAFCSAV